MITALAIAAGVGLAAGLAGGWKIADTLKGAALESNSVEIARLTNALEIAKGETQAARDELVRERVTTTAEDERRDVLEAKLRADLAALQKELHDAAARNPALAGARLDGVLSGGKT